MKNIVLIGMPGAGKSTIGVLLAKTLLLSFEDTDLVVQRVCSKSLSEYIAENGTEKFLRLESDVLCGTSFAKTVTATGGSAVYSEKAMKHLKENGTVIYLDVDIREIERRVNDIKARGVVLTNGDTIRDVFYERAPLYEKYADITVDCNSLTPEQCVEKIVESLSEYNENLQHQRSTGRGNGR